MTQQTAIHSRRKLASVCSLEAYQWLQDWIIEQHPNMRYPGNPMNYFYKNTTHREYLSKWIEDVMFKVLKSKGANPTKSPDKGRSVDDSKVITDVAGRSRVIGSRAFVKDKRVQPGTADIRCFYKGKFWNLEVKVGHDRQSDAQKAEEQRAISNGEKYVIIKMIDDFIELILKNYESNF